MNQNPYSILPPNTGPQEMTNVDLVKQLLAKTNALGIMSVGNSFQEITNTNNTYYLSAGQYPKLNNTTPNFNLVGIAGSKVAGANIASNGVCSDVWFTAGISLASTARVVFNGCRFDQSVVIASGGKATYQGCTFLNNCNSNNAGAAGNVGILGCYRGTLAHVSATIIFEGTL